MKPDPIQIYEKVINEDKTFTRYFSTYFRNLSQYILEIFTLKTTNNLNCIVNGSIVFVKFYSDVGGEIVLPYKSLIDQKLQYYVFENNVWNIKFMDISKDQISITFSEPQIVVDSKLFINRV